MNCFSLPDAGFFGDLARNTLIGPGFASWDMAVFKNISFAHGITYSGHPASAACALEVLKIYEEKKIVELVQQAVS